MYKRQTVNAPEEEFTVIPTTLDSSCRAKTNAPHGCGDRVDYLAGNLDEDVYKRQLLPGLILGNGSVKLPVRKEDANRYRKEVIKDNYNYDIWSHMRCV